MGFVRFQPAPTDAVFAVIMVIAALTGRFRLSRVPLLVRWLVGLLLIVNVLRSSTWSNSKEALQFFFITAYLLIFSVWMAGYLDSRAQGARAGPHLAVGGRGLGRPVGRRAATCRSPARR